MKISSAALIAQIFLSVSSINSSFAEISKLTVKSKNQTNVFTQADLAKLKSHRTLKLKQNSRGEAADLKYEVVPVKDVFKNIDIPKDASIQFTATDGFSGFIKAERLFDEVKNHAHAFIAYQFPKSEEKMGPFYLVWENAKESHISTEEWPYAMATLEVKTYSDVSYPKMQPDPSLKASDPIRKGLAVFQKNCFVCHTLNREGTSQVGPDLNVPFNPTEYFKDDFFERYVRNIQDVHYFPLAKMNTFPKEAISEEEFGQLKAYLVHMTKHKIDR